MKKGISVLVLLAAAAVGGLFAQDMLFSVGGGGFVEYSLGNGMKYTQNNVLWVDDKWEYDVSRNSLGLGGYLFFDATYAEFDFYFASSLIVPAETLKITLADGTTGSATNPIETNGDMTETTLGFQLFGKYPLTETSSAMLGVGYDIWLKRTTTIKVNGESEDLVQERNSNNPGWGDQFSVLLGADYRYYVAGGLFLKADALVRIGFARKQVTEGLKKMPDTTGITATVGIGPVLRVGMGYSF